MIFVFYEVIRGALNCIPVTRVEEGKYTVAGLADITYIGNGLYSFVQEGAGSGTIAVKVLDDGTKIADMGAMSFIQDNMFIPKIALIIAFVIMKIYRGTSEELLVERSD